MLPQHEFCDGSVSDKTFQSHTYSRRSRREKGKSRLVYITCRIASSSITKSRCLFGLNTRTSSLFNGQESFPKIGEYCYSTSRIQKQIAALRIHFIKTPFRHSCHLFRIYLLKTIFTYSSVHNGACRAHFLFKDYVFIIKLNQISFGYTCLSNICNG